MLVNILGTTDDAKCYEMVRLLRWPGGVRCPHCESDRVVKQGRDDAEPQRQRYEFRACGRRFDDLTHTIFAGHHRPLRAGSRCSTSWAGTPPTSRSPGYSTSTRATPSGWRRCYGRDRPAEARGGAQRRGRVRRGVRRGRAQGPPGGGQGGRPGRRRRLKGAPGRGTLAKEEPPVFGRIQRTGEVVIRMLADVKQKAIGPLIRATITPGSTVYTDESDIYARLPEWGYVHRTVCHAAGEFARDEEGGGFCEVHDNAMEGPWSLLRSWLRPHRGVWQEKRPLYLGSFAFVHNVRRRGKALLGSLVGLLLKPSPRNSG